MAYRVLKLITKQTVLADIYNQAELMEFLKHTDDGTHMEKDASFVGPNCLVMVNPVEIVTITQNDKYMIIFEHYASYSNDDLILLPRSALIASYIPNAEILKGYDEYILSCRESNEIDPHLRALNGISKDSMQH